MSDKETTVTVTPEADPYNGMTRQQFINEEKARQLDKSVEYLAGKNAELQADLNAARARVPGQDQVVMSREDAAALATYRDQFPTPKDAKEAKGRLGALEERDELRSYDDARRAALEEYGADLPDSFKSLIPTAEELQKRPGGKEVLRDLDFMKAEVERVAGIYGAEKQDATERTDVGKSPAEVKAGGSAGPDDSGKQAVSNFYARFVPQPPQN